MHACDLFLAYVYMDVRFHVLHANGRTTCHLRFVSRSSSSSELIKISSKTEGLKAPVD